MTNTRHQIPHQHPQEHEALNQLPKWVLAAREFQDWLGGTGDREPREARHLSQGEFKRFVGELIQLGYVQCAVVNGERRYWITAAGQEALEIDGGKCPQCEASPEAL